MRARLLLLALALLTLVGTGAAVVAHRHSDGSERAGASRKSSGTQPGTSLAPIPRGVPTVPAAEATHPTGRGNGLSRLIPCYLLTARGLRGVLGTPMADLGQRAAGSSGFGLRGLQPEDCYWFSTRADGPYVVLSTVTTSQLRDRGLDLTARKYFDTVHAGPRTYLPDLGDAAYVFGPASVAVLVGDVYLDATVVSFDGHALADARALARRMARLRLHQP